MFADSMGVVCFFAVLVGTVAGTYWATVSPVLAEIIGLRDLPSGLSITWLTLVPPCTVSEAIALNLRSHTAEGGTSYIRVQIFTGFVYIGASLCLWVVRGWKVGELECAQQRREALIREQPSTISAAREKENRPANNIKSVAPSVDSTDAQLWAPFSLIRRMVSLKHV